MTFYFTYGLGPTQAYKGGWTEVEAEDRKTAMDAYYIFHKLNADQTRPFDSVRDEKMFLSSSMPKNGNWGAYCHDRIVIHREVF